MTHERSGNSSGERSGPSALGMTQGEMLGRIRAALGSNRPSTIESPAIDERVARLVAKSTDLVSVFVANAEAGGMVVQRVRKDALGSALVTCMRESGAKVVSIACDDSGFASTVAGACKDEAIEIIHGESGSGFDPHYAAQVGVTDVDAAVAETGSLVLSSTPGRGRGPALVPPIHVAIVPASKIVADLIDVWAAIGKERVVEGRAAVVLISGPSKTGDIEGVLVTGVHGPGEVRVFVVEDL